jgi:hypothetical protein
MKKIILSICVASSLFGTVTPKIQDVSTIPQDFTNYALDLNSTFSKYNEEFLVRYYKPWSEDFEINRFNAEFGAKYIAKKTYFGDNRQEVSQAFKDHLVENTNIATFPSVYQNGITIRNTNCRVMPTNKPFFYDFKSSGGGYPFDYLQNSLIHINTPIKVLHYSKDLAFAFVETPYVSGWINSNDIAFVSDMDIKRVKNMKLLTPINDDTTLIGSDERFVSKAFIGATLWKNEKGNIYLFKTNDKNQAVLTLTNNLQENFTTIPTIPTKENLINIAKQLYGQNYGWGGSGENRDCSMLIRDMYTPFGIFLERNSNMQANEKQEEIISLAGKTNEEKIKIIKENAIPFATFLYMKGHIMIYIGTFNDEVTIFHSFWSIKTLNKGRHIVGGSYITSLKPGIELEEYDHQNGTLLDKLVSMRVLGYTNNENSKN